MKEKRIQIRVNEKNHTIIKDFADKKGMTIKSVIKVALKKVFGLDI